jgi:DEP domain-containing protein 5
MATSSGLDAVQKLCTLRIHDANVSRDDVIFNVDRFPELGLKPGNLVQIVAVREGAAVRDFEKRINGQKHASSGSKFAADMRGHIKVSSASSRVRDPKIITFEENGNVVSGVKERDLQRSYVFQIQELTPDQKLKYQGVLVRLARKIYN